MPRVKCCFRHELKTNTPGYLLATAQVFWLSGNMLTGPIPEGWLLPGSLKVSVDLQA